MAASLSAMLAPVDGGKARRKVVTYGKASRRQTSGHSPPRMITTPPASEFGACEDDHKQEYGVVARKNPPGVSVCTPAAGSGKIHTRSTRSGSLGRKGGNDRPDVARPSILLPPLDRAVYDVPSSDDEHNLEQALGCASMGKRRKIQLSTTRDNSGIVHDDASLQRHIAAEAGDKNSRVPGKCKAPSFERNKKDQEVRVSKTQSGSRITSTVEEHPVSLTGASRGPLHPLTKKLAGSNGKLTRRTTRIKQGPTPEPITSHQRVPMVVSPALAKVSKLIHKHRMSPGISLAPAEPTPALSPGRVPGPVQQETAIPSVMQNARLRTPSPSHKYVAPRTTPRQRELWSILLAEGNQEIGPNFLNIKKLCLTPSVSAEQPSLGLVTQHAETALGTFVEQPRRRLVDKLYGQESACRLLHRSSEPEADMSDIESNSNTSLISKVDGTNTMVPSLTIESQSMDLNTRIELFQKPLQLVKSLPGEGPKVTYARQRSYLTESDVDEVASFSATVVQDRDSWSGTSRRGRRSEVLVPKPNLYVEDKVDDGDGEQGGAVRSIHELREAGGNARFASEMESLIDDIDEITVPLAVRRRGLQVVVVKLQDPKFCRRLVDYGLVHRLMAHAESSTDLVSNILLAASMLYLVARKNSFDIRHQGIEQCTLDFLIRLLDIDLDIVAVAKDRRNNMSKVAQTEFSELRRSLLEPSLWTNGPPPKVTARILAIQCLEYLVRQVREKDSAVDFMSKTAIKRMVELLVPASLPSATASEIFVLRLAVSTLESCTISGSAMCEETAWTGETIERLTGLLPAIEAWPESEEMFGCLRTLVLRLYLNITNNNPRLCEAFSRPEVVRAMLRIITSHFESLAEDGKKDTQALLLDNLILSLGFLINLAEWSDNARRLVLPFERDTDSPLGTLLQLFQRKLQRAAEAVSEEETSFNVAFGYLSVLLSNLCIDGIIRAQVRSRLRGGTLKQLLDAVEEFLHYHKQVDDQICQAGEETDAKAGFVGRLQSVVDRLKQVDGQASGVTFLQA
ncbi:Wings apart-like protein [Lasallia pustulata]|uniref:Wings apart-like protein n=1 Tax=Lasallia pustulata TaxID=136370 RepID=A0A1W5D7G2_9LECA|nr:Wings apart-like protein [Lasallia pustulata]